MLTNSHIGISEIAKISENADFFVLNVSKQTFFYIFLEDDVTDLLSETYFY